MMATVLPRKRFRIFILATVALAATPLRATVTVSGPPSNYLIAIDSNESVAIACAVGTGNVQVTVNGMTDVPTSQPCNTVNQMTVAAFGSFDNTIDIRNVSSADYTTLVTLTVSGGDGNDTIIPTPSFGPSVVTLDGGAGTDTLDHSPFSSAVAVNLGANTPGLSATLGADQENPTTASTATGTATLTYDNSARTFDISVSVSGIDPATVTGFHIHRAPAGVNGPIIVNLGTASFVPDGMGGFTYSATGLTLPSINEAAFLGGVTYVNVHTPANPGGAIRGQIMPTSAFVAATATATTAIIATFENVTGSSMSDSLVGDLSANTLLGGSGGDYLLGTPGNDTIDGENDNDVIAWNNSDGSDVIEGGVGTDVVQVNGGLGSADLFTIGAGSASRLAFARTSPAPFSLDIGSAETLTVNGLTGADTMTVNSLTGVASLTTINLFGNADVDTFSVVPSTTVSIVVKGGLPNPPSVGDALAISTGGTTNPTLSTTSTATGFSGSYNFGSSQPVSFQWLESLDPLPELSITKSDSPDPVVRGTNLTYSITITNNGAVAAGSVGLNDVIPSNTTFVSLTVPVGWTSTTPPVGATGTVTATNPSVAGSSAAAMTLVVKVDASTVEGTTITNTATVTTATYEANTTNNSATTTTVTTVPRPAAPTNFVATAVSTSQADLSWNAVSDAVSYDIYRSSGFGPFALVASTSGTTLGQTSLSANTTYLYRIRAVNAEGFQSVDSTLDPATTVMFDPISAGTTIRAVHFTQTQTAVNAFRVAAGLSTVAFAPANVGAVILASDINAIRNAWLAARLSLGMTSIGLVDPTITAGVTVKDEHLKQIQLDIQ